MKAYLFFNMSLVWIKSWQCNFCDVGLTDLQNVIVTWQMSNNSNIQMVWIHYLMCKHLGKKIALLIVLLLINEQTCFKIRVSSMCSCSSGYNWPGLMMRLTMNSDLGQSEEKKPERNRKHFPMFPNRCSICIDCKFVEINKINKTSWVSCKNAKVLYNYDAVHKWVKHKKLKTLLMRILYSSFCRVRNLADFFVVKVVHCHLPPTKWLELIWCRNYDFLTHKYKISWSWTHQ